MLEYCWVCSGPWLAQSAEQKGKKVQHGTVEYISVMYIVHHSIEQYGKMQSITEQD